MFDYDNAMADEANSIFTNTHTPQWSEEEQEEDE